MSEISIAPGVKAHLGAIQENGIVTIGVGVETPFGPYRVLIDTNVATLKRTILELRKKYGPKLYDFVTTPSPQASVGAMSGGSFITRASLGLRKFQP